FTLAAARRTAGIVTALDIDPALIALVNAKAEAAGLSNIRVLERDFVANDFGVAPNSQAHVMIYNLLHMEEPLLLLRKAREVLAANGTVSIMHWRTDIPTPRGPPAAIRPTPETCATWLSQAGFSKIQHVDLRSSCPFHYGLTAAR
ncbi:MAG: class I SAM-dependent methyltransferase, partial [Rhodanobacter sp.]